MPASWVRRDWAMTSSPTRSIISSSRSAGTRTFSADFACLESLAACTAGASRSATTTALAIGVTAGFASAAGRSTATSVISSSMSSMTKMKTSSISARGRSVFSVTSQLIWMSRGSSAESSGTFAVSATIRHSPRSRISSSRPSGLVPFAMAFTGRLKRMRHSLRPPAASATGAAATAAVTGEPAPLTARCRPSSSAALIASWSPFGVSSSARMWSCAERTAETSSCVAGTSPLRTRSKAVSQWWVKAASASKPNIAPDPFNVCRPRKTASIRSRSSRLRVRSRRPDSICSSSSAASVRKTEIGSGFVIFRGPSWRS